MELREWQQECLGDYVSKNMPEHYCVEAPPATGKTILALSLADRRIRSGVSKSVFVITHQEPTKFAWAKTATLLNINLNPNHKTGPIADDYNGVCATVQQIFASPESAKWFAAQLKEPGCFVIVDEVHHYGEDNNWGNFAELARDTARVVLSGTPFRSSQCRISLWKYDADGFGRPDYKYSKEQAYVDRLIPKIHFATANGPIDYTVYASSHTGLTATQFNYEDLTDVESDQYGRAILNFSDPETPAFSKNVKELTEWCRQQRKRNHPNAGLHFLCDNIKHAIKVAAKIRAITNEEASLVVSNVDYSMDEELADYQINVPSGAANELIDDFNRSDSMWIVSVSMLNESVDIPRLRGLIWGSRKRTPLMFRQSIGRLERIYPGLDRDKQECRVIIPEVLPLVDLAKEFHEEQERAIRELEEIGCKNNGTSQDLDAPRIWQENHDNASQTTGIIVDGVKYDSEDLVRYERMIAKMGKEGELSALDMLRAAEEVDREERERDYYLSVMTQESEPEPPLYEIKKRLSGENQRLTTAIVNNLRQRWKRSDIEYNRVRAEANHLAGVKECKKESATLDQMQRVNKALQDPRLMDPSTYSGRKRRRRKW